MTPTNVAQQPGRHVLALFAIISIKMTIDETLNQLIAMRNSAIYRLIDYRIGIGEWKLEDRQQHFAELLAILERTEQKVFGPEVLH
jgi:hypothetical protein